MTSAVRTFLWACVLAKSIVTPAQLPEPSDEGFIDECVREHNRARSSVVPTASDMLHMTWDKDLAMTAREWARKCTLEHNPDLKSAGRLLSKFSSVGKNIWTGNLTTLFNATQAIRSWVDEKQDYDYDSNACNNVCSHYKQVVWAETSKVGCAVHSCPNGVQATTLADRADTIFVCNYASAGNVNGGQPYRSEGKFCAGCEELPEKAFLRSSAVNTNWKSLQKPTDLNYATILIIRPLGVVVTLATAYGFQQYYPNIFCYE